MSNLKPCPFCGKKPKVKINYGTHETGPREGERTKVYSVTCVNPSCMIYNAEGLYFPRNASAVKAWNTRMVIKN